MNDDIIDFAENIVGVKLNDWQKEILLKLQNAKDKDEELFMYAGRKTGMSFIKSILFNFNLLQKVKQLNHQKAMWNELKGWLKKEQGYTSIYEEQRRVALEEILEQMQKLEGEDE